MHRKVPFTSLVLLPTFLPVTCAPVIGGIAIGTGSGRGRGGTRAGGATGAAGGLLAGNCGCITGGAPGAL